MTPAHITRLLTFAQTGQPKKYAASELMRSDLAAVLKAQGELQSKLEALARTVMNDQTAHDLPRIRSGKPLWQLIVEENERWLKEQEA